MMTWRDDGSGFPGRMRWRCPDCGTGVAADEDGCCVTCGATCAAEPDDGAPPLSDDDLAVRQAAVEAHGLRAGQRMFHSAAMAAEDVVEAAMDGDDARAARRLEDARRFGRVASALAGAPLDAGGRCRVCGCTDPDAGRPLRGSRWRAARAREAPGPRQETAAG